MKIFTTKKWRLALLPLIAVVAISSCKKKDRTDDPVPNVQQRLSKIEQNATNYITFGYTAKGLLNKFKSVNDNLSSEAEFVYDNTSNQLMTGSWDGFNMEFSRKNNLLDRVYFTPDATNPASDEHYLKFSYANGRVSQTVDYVAEGNGFIPRAKHTYEYYANGDVKSQTYYYLAAMPDQWEQLERNVYEYEDMKNARQIPDEVAYTCYMSKSVHNLKKIMSYDASNALDETITYTSTYNNLGLPTTALVNITYPNSPAISFTLKYSYQ
ncbi:MAG: hypothetical protein V4619_03800 [Bacteroidota bacterium]